MAKKIAPALVPNQQTATQDSEVGAHISSSSTDEQDTEPAARRSAGVAAAAAAAAGPPSRFLQAPEEDGSGHHDPKQRRLYLALLAFTGLNALVGLTLLLIWMLRYRPVTGFSLSDKGGLANLHVLLMFTFMVSLNMYAVLVYRTHYSRPKHQLKWVHAIMSGSNMAMSLLGVLAMYKAHLLGNLANFYSLHSWIGIATNAFYVAQFSLAFVSFLKPGLSQRLRAQLMPWHRLAGAFIVVLAACAAITGTAELVIFQDREGAYQSFTPITFIANFMGISVILMTATTVYLLTASQYRRPQLAEEVAIKR